MKLLKNLALVSMATLSLTWFAKADYVLTLPADGASTTLPINATAIAAALGGGVTAASVGSLLYKGEADGDLEEGNLSGSYDTTFEPPADPTKATISFIGYGVIADPTYLILKDGIEGWLVWDISDWNGMDTIVIDSVFIRHAISHVSIWGKPGETISDGGTSVALLGTALGLLGLMRRKLGKA